MKNSGQVIEVINRNAVVSEALKAGFIAYLPVLDAGVDFILYRESDDKTFKVQLKSRWTIDKKYIGRNILVAFPDRENWYLVPHDEMVLWANDFEYANSLSWKDNGLYSLAPLSVKLKEKCAPYLLPDGFNK